MENISFYTFLTLLFLIEGVGIVGGREIAYLLLLVSPFILFINLLIQKKGNIIIPKIVVPFICFFIFSSISAYYSSATDTSFLYIFIYISCFLLFLYIVNTPNIEKGIIPFLFCMSFVYCIYSTLIHYFLLRQWEFLVPHNSVQFVYSYYGFHNHLGDILVFPLFVIIDYLFIKNFNVISSFQFIKHPKVFYTLLLIFFLPFFIFSFSRTAYIVLSIMLILDIFFKRKKVSRQIVSTLGICLFLIFLTGVTTSGVTIFPLKESHTFFSNSYNLGLKSITGERIVYGSQAMNSFIKKPYWGVGPGNFSEISNKYSHNNQEYTTTSHNIFLDILSENGVFAFLAFIVMIYMVICCKRSIYYFLLVGFLISFQTDYLFKFSSIIYLFVVLGAVVYRDTFNSNS